MQVDELPSASVIIPVYNAPADLRMALESVTDQTYPTDAYEVVVVDNDSDDRTAEVAERFAAAHPDLVTVTSETNIQSSYAARNRGICESTGEVVAFIDADVTVDRDWLETGVKTMLELDAEYMGCEVQMYCPDRTLVGKYDALTGFPVERYVEEHDFAPTCGLFVAREVFRDVGTFDERLISGGDAVFGQQVAASGRELHYTDEVCVYHSARSTLRSLVGKHVRVGRGLAQRDRWHSEQHAVGSVLRPSRYLPPHPLRFPESVGAGWTDLSAGEKVGMYAIGYVQRLSRFAGRVRESLGAIGGGREVEREADLVGPVHHQDD